MSARSRAASGDGGEIRAGVKKTNKKGATMVEAAMIFPLVTAAVMALIYLCVNLYTVTVLQSAVHIALRKEAGIRSGLTRTELTDAYARDKYRAKAERAEFKIEGPEHLWNPYLQAFVTKEYAGNAMATGKVKRKSGGRFYVIDEAATVRWKIV